MKNKYAVRIAWSQTDIKTVLIYAKTPEIAEKRVKERLPRLNHILGCSKIDIDFN